MPETLTHSRLACFRACPRRHQLRYELLLRPEIDSDVLRIGRAFAVAVEADSKGLDAETALAGRLDDPFEAAMVAAMFTCHKARWSAASLESVAEELPFDIPVLNPETGRDSRVWRLAGRIDRIVRLADGRLALMEYKTTSRDFAPGSHYWTRLHLDLQLSIYLIAARELGYAIDTILYDVTRRPSLRPLKATPPEVRKYTKDGRLYATQRETDETPEEFAVRVSTYLSENAEASFARIEIARTDDELRDCRREVWAQQLVLREAQRSGCWYRNPESCVSATGTTCEYLPICQFNDLDVRTPLGFRRAEDAHEELTRLPYADPGQAGYARPGQAGHLPEGASDVR